MTMESSRGQIDLDIDACCKALLHVARECNRIFDGLSRAKVWLDVNQQEVASAPLASQLVELVAESFVSGSVLTQKSSERISYVSPTLSHELQSAGLTKEDLTNLDRPLAADAAIEKLAWAAAFSRNELERRRNDDAYLDSRAATIEEIGKLHPLNSENGFDSQQVNRYFVEHFSTLGCRLIHEFASQNRASSVISCSRNEMFGIALVVQVEASPLIFPISIKMYALPYCENAIFAISKEALLPLMKWPLLHPLWILVPGFGAYVSSRNSDQLSASAHAHSQLVIEFLALLQEQMGGGN